MNLGRLTVSVWYGLGGQGVNVGGWEALPRVRAGRCRKTPRLRDGRGCRETEQQVPDRYRPPAYCLQDQCPCPSVWPVLSLSPKPSSAPAFHRRKLMLRGPRHLAQTPGLSAASPGLRSLVPARPPHCPFPTLIVVHCLWDH